LAGALVEARVATLEVALQIETLLGEDTLLKLEQTDPFNDWQVDAWVEGIKNCEILKTVVDYCAVVLVNNKACELSTVIIHILHTGFPLELICVIDISPSELTLLLTLVAETALVILTYLDR
jgi:hypothetical protein